MNIRQPAIDYNFPESNPSPFDVESEAAYYIYASGYSNLSADINDFSLEQLNLHVSMGYKSILLCKRIGIIGEGVILKSWETEPLNGINDERIAGKYCIHANRQLEVYVPNWKKDLKTYMVPKPGTDMISIYSCLWENAGSCIAFSKEMSVKENIYLLVSQVIEFENWH